MSSAPVSPYLARRRLVATALVVVAAVGAGVLLRGRLTAPPAGVPESAPTDQRPAANVSGAPGELATAVDVRTPAPTEPPAETPAPGEGRGTAPEPTAEAPLTTEAPATAEVPATAETPVMAEPPVTAEAPLTTEVPATA